MNHPLSKLIAFKRRYARSVNLERDIARSEALDGYVPTERALEALERILSATQSNATHRAWTVTGVYGTGKSSFAHLLAVALGPISESCVAHRVLSTNSGGSSLSKALAAQVPAEGFVRAVATARREPLAHTVLRAISVGAEMFWSSRRGRRPAAAEEVRTRVEALNGGVSPRTDDLPELARAVSRASGTGLLLVIDEMGKNLEAAARSGGADDLYLLQRLAELPSEPGEPPVLVVGLLHQGFVEYGTALSAAQRAEWDKVQGRYEDLPFSEAPEETLRLVADAMESDFPSDLASAINASARAWHGRLTEVLKGTALLEASSAERLAAVYPLHPVAALALPTLCARYAQNDRSLFTFLTSPERHSLASFVAAQGASCERLPLLGLSAVFDYFLDGGAPASRPQFQRWSEIHAIVNDIPGRLEDETKALKVIGTLNLIDIGGALRASRGLVLTALIESPNDREEEASWSAVLESLVARRIVTYRSRVDEYRLWEGSDYDTEAAVQGRLDADRRTLAEVLEAITPMDPIVAPRHSYQTGTLRFFERRYAELADEVPSLTCRAPDSDGLLIYWLSESVPHTTPAELADGRPVALLVARRTQPLEAAARELAALLSLEATDPALGRDGVARREVRQRILLARRSTEVALRDAFDGVAPWTASGGELPASLGAALSTLCDRTFSAAPILWNEMVNRRELTAQGARARRVLIEAMLSAPEKERLGLSGEGPEFAIYASVLLESGIHRRDADGTWGFGPPTSERIRPLWDAVANFCLEAQRRPQTLDELYSMLARPPYGVKPGVVPVILAAVLLHHVDDITVYRDGTFLPQLGPEHFEILVKNPSRFAVKHLALAGIRWELFQDLAASLAGGGMGRNLPQLRNATLLGVVRPLVRFASNLPAVTRRANDLSPEAHEVREALITASEPDKLIFDTLPKAVGLRPFSDPTAASGIERVREFRRVLFQALRELESYYDRLLERCRTLIHEAFGVRSDPARLREDLRVRSQYLLGRCVDPMLKRLTAVAVEADRDERNWLESIVMVVADRPAETWTGDDSLVFELNLSELSRRFSRLEALLREAPPREGFDARRVAVTNSDGHEIQRIVWIDRAQQELVAQRAQKYAEEIAAFREPHLREAIALRLFDLILCPDLNQTEGTETASPTPLRVSHG